MATATRATDVAVEGLRVSAYSVPTDQPESDGTLEWDSTTIVVIEARGGGQTGIGYTYGDVAVATLIRSQLAERVEGADALAPATTWAAMHAALRNAGQQGVGAMALSAVDIALWDLKARILGVPLADLLPRFHRRVPVYGSGGFTSYTDDRLASQLAGWVDAGIPRVKMKIGREPARDPERLAAARDAVGPEVQLMVDANGAYGRMEASAWAHRLKEEWDVSYLEEPVTSNDLEGLRLVRDQAPPGLAIAAGEYAWDVYACDLLLRAKAVDILQADVTRCGGITALLRIDGLCAARAVPFSAHCAPAVSAHACCGMQTALHIEYFHDHTRIEGKLFDGVVDAREGFLEPDRDRPGLGLELRRPDASEFEVA
jgi:L-alanine-DL-glutamate epimerase-like enolase superfamily enzyme